MQDITFALALVALLAQVVHLVAHRLGWVKVEAAAQTIEDKAEGK